MRVLVLTPFAPRGEHDHAAADTLVKLIPRLAREVELFVYCPAVGSSSDATAFHEVGERIVTGRATRFGVRPAWLRASWPTAATREALRLARALRPDVVHCEYLHTAEVALELSNCVLGVHDITGEVFRANMRNSRGPAVLYRYLEYQRARVLEQKAFSSAAALVALSPTDLEVLSRQHADKAFLARPAVELPGQPWKLSDDQGSDVLFAGALWRRANQLAVEKMFQEVMPRVWREVPESRLIVVGSRPPESLVRLSAADSRVLVRGFVPDLDDEMPRARVVVAPTVVGGGVLMKLLRGLALGCPVVADASAVASVEADPSAVVAAAGANDMAVSIVRLLRGPAEAARLGSNARAFVASKFAWEQSKQGYLSAYELASSR